MDFNRRAKKRKLKDMFDGGVESVDVNSNKPFVADNEQVRSSRPLKIHTCVRCV